MPQGQGVDFRERQLVVRLKGYVDQERQQGLSVSTHDAGGRVAQALGLGKRTVQEMLSTYQKAGQGAVPALEANGTPPSRLQPAVETMIRQRMRALNRQGSQVSVRSLAHWLSEHYAEVPRATVGRTLQRMGLVYGKARKKSALRERDEVVIARRAYLRTTRANRAAHGGTVRPEGYLDASYVNVNQSTPRTWYFAEEGPWGPKPSGQGPRFILVHAITTEGWVQGAQVVLQAQRRPGDDHGQRDFEHGRRWFRDAFLPHLPSASLMVMENAPYHTVYVDGVFSPTTSRQKAELQRWLQQNHPPMDQEAMIKAELLAVCRQLCPTPAYALDRLAEAAGHQILRTPQYHPELQPMENCWAVVKKPCAAKCDSTMAGLRAH